MTGAGAAQNPGAKEYSYQGGQVTLLPEQVFDITGKVQKTEITVSDFGSGSEFGVSLVLNDQARQAFKDFTEKNIGREVGLMHQSRLLLVAVMQGAIPFGIVQISAGSRTIEEAKMLAAEFNGK